MKTIAITMSALLVLAGAAALAQSAPEEKSPYEWKAEGETAETFKASLVVNQKVDQSTARGVVEAYLGFSDGRDSTRKADGAIRQTWQKALQKSLATDEEALLAKEARDALGKARAEKDVADSARDRTAPATQVTAEAKVDDNTVTVETLQKVVNKVPGKDGKVNESTWETKLRFTCVRGADGKWQIGKVERYQQDWGAEAETWVWKSETGMLGFMYMMVNQKAPPPAAALVQDTPEKAALSLYSSLIARQEALSHRLAKVALPSWVSAVEPLFTAAYVEAAKLEAEVQEKRGEEDEPAPKVEVDSVTDAEGGLKVVKFKPISRWQPAVQATLKQVDGKWRVLEAGLWENVGGIDRGPQYRAVGDVYSLPKP